MNKVTQIVAEIVLFCIAVFLVFKIVKGIQHPVEFNEQKAIREAVAIQRLKDIRTLQVAYKGEHGKFVSTIDSLKAFYDSGKVTIMMNVGSMDDSAAVAHTKAIRQANRKITDRDLLKLYNEGDKNLVFSVKELMNVKDTLFNNRKNFCIDSLAFIPFSGKDSVQMTSVTKAVSGVMVPLFEAKMPYRSLLKGLDNQLRINLDADCRDKNKFEGLQVGDINTPNNNAGNWE